MRPALHLAARALPLALFGCVFHAPELDYRSGDPVTTSVGEVHAASLTSRPLGARGSVVHVELQRAPSGVWPLPADSLRVFSTDGIFERSIKPVAFDSGRGGVETGRRFVLEFPESQFTPDARGRTLSRRIAFTSESELLPRVFELTVMGESTTVSAEPGVTTDPASGFVQATYPLWGFPRDVLDAPLTLLNRGGIGTMFETEGCEKGKDNATGSKAIVGLSMLTGLVAGSIYGVHHAGAHYAKTMLYSSGGAIGGGLAGAAIGGAAVGAYGVGVIPAQTALLRSGFDDEYLKGDRARLSIDGDWTDADVAAWERHERSLSYFPNWRYGVCGERRTLPDAAAKTESVWVVRSLEMRELDASTR